MARRIAQALDLPLYEDESGSPLPRSAPLAHSLLWVVQMDGRRHRTLPAGIGLALRRNPWTLVVPVVTPDLHPTTLVELGTLGITRVLRWPGSAPAPGFRRNLMDVFCAGVGDVVRRQLAGVDPTVVECLAWSASAAHREPEAEHLSTRLAVPPRSLARRLRQFGGLALAETLTLGRVIQAMYRLALTGRSVESIASSVGFASASGLRRALGRTVGGQPSDYRHRAAVVAGMEQVVARLPGRERRRFH